MSPAGPALDTRLFRWLYAAVVNVAKDELRQANEGCGTNWPMGQTWEQLGGSSRGTFMHAARERLGIPHDEFLAIVRSGAVDVEEIFDTGRAS